MEVEYHFYQYCPAILVIFESYLSVPKISKDIKCFKENIFFVFNSWCNVVVCLTDESS